MLGWSQVEESGNLLLMLAGLVNQEPIRASTLEALQAYWPVLNGFADYIIASLPDPGDQLCTDDFEGPSPHNANLAAKGIVALAAWSSVLNTTGSLDFHADVLRYAAAAKTFAGNWTSLALAESGDHYKMAYDDASSWSLK